MRAQASEGRQVDDLSAQDDVLVDLRCSVVVLKADRILLLRRTDLQEWVLPGGRPKLGESMLSCARREVWEETGLHVDPTRCAFVLEVTTPDRASHLVELVFLAAPILDGVAPAGRESLREPQWVRLEDLGDLTLRPPLAGHLRALARDRRSTAPYLGNVWRPTAGGNDADAATT